MVEAIWRFPLKSARGQQLARVPFGLDGPVGDRAWACVAADGRIVSAKHPRRWGRLLEVVAVVDESDFGGDRVLITVPGGSPVEAGSTGADAVLSAWLGEPVTLSRVVPDDASLERWWPGEEGMMPEWATGHAGEVQTTEVAGAEPGGRFVDFAAVHLVTTGQLSELAAEGVDADVRRFRPNLVLDIDVAPGPGDVINVGGELRLRVSVPTPRCAIPGAAQPGLARSREVLRAIGRRRVDIAGYGRAAVFGAYADVLRPGTANVGDPVTLSA